MLSLRNLSLSFNKQVFAKMWKKGNSYVLLVGLHVGAGTMENIMEAPKKIKNTNTLWPTNSTPGYLSKEI